MISNVLEEKKVKSVYQKVHYEMIIFIMFFMAFLVTVPDRQNLNEWTSIYYIFSYADFGFRSRLVIGSIIRLFTDYVSSGLIYKMATAFSILFIAISSVVLGKIIRNISKNTNTSPELFIVLFVACPVSIQYLFNINNFGRFDSFSILIAAAIILCIRNKKAKWLTPVLCMFAIVFNYNFVLMYMPVIAVVMLYEYMVNGYSKTHLLIFAVSCIAVAALFIYFKVLSPAPGFSSPDQMKVFLAGKTDIQDAEFPAFSEFCFPLANIYMRDAKQAYSWFFDLLKVYGPFILFSTAPVFAVFISFWIKAMKNAQQKLKKVAFFLCLSSPAASLPMFLAIDWDRWIPTLFISQFMLVLYFIAVNDKDAVNSLASLKNYFSRHSFFFAVMVIYSASSIFSNSYSVYVSVMINHIDKFLSFA